MNNKIKQSALRAKREFFEKHMPEYQRFDHDASKVDVPFKMRQTVNAGIEPYSGPWGERQIAHLMKRTMFGLTKADFNAVKNMSREQLVDALLTETEKPPVPVNDYNNPNEGIEDPEIPFGEPWITGSNDIPSDVQGSRILSLKAWWLKQMLGQKISIHEKMNFFWHNHLVVEFWGVFSGTWLYEYLDTIRTHALGNFKSLMRAITIDRAMLIYLNGFLNNKFEPDENFARELQELFCIGKALNPHYSEDDVKMAAKVLTGWTINYDDPNMETVFYPPWHDDSDKQFSAFYNNRVIQGRSGSNAGNQELDELLDMIFDHPEVARFIVRKIYRFFVYTDIDPTTEFEVIEPLAQIFRDNNYEIKPVLKALFNSAHFFDEANYGVAIKSPLDFLAGLWRTLGLEIPPNYGLFARYAVNVSTHFIMGDLGLELGDPPNVAGYPAWYQQPGYDKLWITTSTIAPRGLTTDSIVYWGLWNYVEPIAMDVLAFAKKMDRPEDPNELIREILLLVHGIPLTEVQFNNLKSILLSGNDDAYWTQAWNEYLADPNDEIKSAIVRERLQWTLENLLQMAETQLM